MNIIKLNAIDSTNSYLKQLTVKKQVENFSVVFAEEQISGRGQIGTIWESDRGKNLTFSIIIQIENLKIVDQFYLCMAVSLGILQVLKAETPAKLSIKWPNDILAENNKLVGILIENVLSGNNIKHSIVGVGLNVNQQEFSKNLLNVTSLKNISGIHFDRDELLLKIIKSIKYFTGYLERNDFKTLKKMYLESLYKFQTPAMFEDKSGTIFLGKIITVSEDGKLVIELENETTREFNLKEIKFASR